MELVLVTSLFGVCMLGMSVGVLLSNRRLQGSCGGLSALGEDADSCGACGKKVADMCPSDEELVRIAQIAHPNPVHHR